MTNLLFVNAAQVVTCAGPARARKGSAMADAGVVSGVAVAVSDGKIAALGAAKDLVAAYSEYEIIDCNGGVLTPGLVDSHTHAVFGKPRYEEHELRAQGHDYMEIARRGGGIHSSVADFRQRTEDELYNLAFTRVVATWLGAHEIPHEFRTSEARRAEFLELLVETMLPEVQRQGVARFADVFCEPGVFTLEEARRVLVASRSAGLGVKIHADELKPYGGAELAVELGATSADHLAAISDAGIAAVAGSGVVATLLPGTMFFLGKPRQAPARALIDAGAAVALASDFNPGTSPTVNFPLMLTLGVSQLRMTAAEAIVAATVNGAAALGLAGETGQIAPGFQADLALFAIADYRELPYWYGARLCVGAWRAGLACRPYEAEGKLNDLYPQPRA